MRYPTPAFAVLAAIGLAIPTLIAVAPAAAAAPTTRAAPPVQPYNQAAFEAAQRAGKPILVWVHAPWCPVCREQAKTIARVTAAPAYRDMKVFRIDFDTQRPMWQRFGAIMQSTLIAYRGRRETARIAHDTNEARVSAVISSAVV